MSIRPRLIHCFSATFPALAEREILTSSADSLGDWDSMTTVTLVALVEEEFDVVFDPSEIATLTSFAAIERKLAQRIAK